MDGTSKRGPREDSPATGQLADLQEELLLAKRERGLNDALFEIGRHMSLARDAKDVGGLVLGLACDALGATCGSIDRREFEGWITRHVYGSSLARLGAFHCDAEVPALAEMSLTDHPVTVPSTDSRGESDSACSGGADCSGRKVSFPLTSRGEVSGALTFCFDGSHAIADEQIAFGTRLAAMFSVSEENWVAMRRHQRIAEAFQRALVDVPHSAVGLDVGHLYVPSADAEFSGGDFYDVFPLEDGRIAVTVGDIAGRGVAAAALSALARDSIRVTALDGLSPGEVLSKTNRVLLAFSSPEMYATVQFAIVDPSSLELAYAGGGSPPMLLLTADRRVESIESGGSLLGVLSDVQFETRRRELGPGDRLVFYTNGLSDLRCGHAEFGVEGISAVMRDADGTDARGLARQLHEGAVRFAGPSFQDDAAILVIGIGG